MNEEIPTIQQYLQSLIIDKNINVIIENKLDEILKRLDRIENFLQVNIPFMNEKLTNPYITYTTYKSSGTETIIPTTISVFGEVNG